MRIMAAGPFFWHSSAMNPLPNCGWTPRTSRKLPVTNPHFNRTGSPSPFSVKPTRSEKEGRTAASPSNEWLSSRQSRRVAWLVRPGIPYPLRFGLAIQTKRLGSRKGRGRNRTAVTRLKIVVFAAIPKATVSIATIVKPGLLSN